jgi:hypothetical protein
MQFLKQEAIYLAYFLHLIAGNAQSFERDFELACFKQGIAWFE